MKSLHISLITAMALSCTALSANTLQEALKDGKFSGEFSATYESKDQPGTQESAYSVGSFAMKYESGVWNNFSITAKARAYTTLFEDESNDVAKSGEFGTDHEGDNAQVFENIYLRYEADGVKVTVGRQFLATDWMEHVHDAVSFYGTWGGTSVEAVNSLRVGKITAREYDNRSDTNPDDKNAGVYKLAVTQKFTENVAATGYYLTYPDSHDKYGARVNVNVGSFAFKAHYSEFSPDSGIGAEDNGLIELTASYTINGWTPYIGYVQITDNNSTINNFAYASEEIVNQMEEGDGFFLPDAQTIYVGLSKAFGPVNATLLYGTSEWETDAGSRDYDETTLWLGYPITKALAFNAGITTISGSEGGNASGVIPDKEQINATFIYSF